MPIINSKEMEFTCKIIEDLGVGIGVELNEIGNIKNILQKFDKVNFKSNAK